MPRFSWAATILSIDDNGFILTEDRVWHMSQEQYPSHLPNAPLAEVIFELRWLLTEPQPGSFVDPGFKLLLGRYYDQIRSKYPKIQDLPASHVPEELTPNVVRHQFKPEKGTWPLTQLGPGILTLNETSAYNWSSFQGMAEDCVGALFASYPHDIAPLSPVQAQLRYVNAIPLEGYLDEPSLLKFFEEKLHVGLNIQTELFEDPKKTASPGRLNLNLAYLLDDPPGAGSLIFSTGAKEGKPAVIWQIEVRSVAEQVPKTKEEFSPWLVQAHRVAERWFFKMCDGSLRERFEETGS